MDHKFLSNIENYKIDDDPGPFSKNNEFIYYAEKDGTVYKGFKVLEKNSNKGLDIINKINSKKKIQIVEDKNFTKFYSKLMHVLKTWEAVTMSGLTQTGAKHSPFSVFEDLSLLHRQILERLRTCLPAHMCADWCEAFSIF